MIKIKTLNGNQLAKNIARRAISLDVDFAVNPEYIKQLMKDDFKEINPESASDQANSERSESK